jgi:hypothetical protein
MTRPGTTEILRQLCINSLRSLTPIACSPSHRRLNHDHSLVESLFASRCLM